MRAESARLEGGQEPSPGVRRGTLAIEERLHAYVPLLFQRRVVSASPGGWRGTVAIEERLHAYVPLVLHRSPFGLPRVVVGDQTGDQRETTNGRPFKTNVKPTGDHHKDSKGIKKETLLKKYRLFSYGDGMLII